MPPAPSLPLSNRGARGLLAALCLAAMLSSLGTSIANVGLPALSAAFGAPFSAIQWVLLAYLVASTLAAALAGRLGDRHGHRRVLLGGIALFTAASFACAQAPDTAVLIAARAAQGAGAAAMLALALPFAGAALPAGRTGSAVGLLGSMSAAGTALGPAAGGVLLSAFGWPALFLACVPPGLCALLLAWRFLPADGLPRREAASPAGTARPALYAGLGANLLVTAVVMTTLVAGPFYLSGALGLDSALVGLVMACGPLAAMLAGMPSGRAVDRHGSGKVALAGLGCMAGGCALLALLPVGAGVAGYAIPLVLCTTGHALFQAANGTAVMAAAASGRRGTAAGLLGLSRNLGLMLGAGAMGALFAAAAGIDGPGGVGSKAAALATGMRVTFGTAVVLVGAAALLVLRMAPGRIRAAP